MRQILLVFGLVIGLLASSTAQAKVRAGDRAAELSSVKDGSGRRLKLKRYRGKVVVLTFGASWCKPCAKELPAYEKLSRKFSKKKVVFLAVNIDSGVAAGKKFFRRLGVKRMVKGFDPSKGSVESWDPPTMPSTFVIDKRGIVRHMHKGYESGDAKALGSVIRKHL